MNERRSAGNRVSGTAPIARAGDPGPRLSRELGAPLWAARAEAELGRLPIRRRMADELTAAEERVATLAGRGLTNRQIAHELFMSPKPVEANLTRVYGKLGVPSRTALAARMAEVPPSGGPPKT